jgi:hypothetical protein
MNQIDKCLAKNLSTRRVMVEFQYQATNERWVTIRFIYLERRDEEVVVRRPELWAEGQLPSSPVRVGINGTEGGERVDVIFRNQ